MITGKTIEFLTENKKRNSKEWFDLHKDQYQQDVVSPLVELVRELTPFMISIDPHIVCDPKVGRTVSRIHRDIRFSKDKSLYREDAWISFSRDKKQFPAYPQFFFMLTPQRYVYGCGYFVASPDSMKRIRSLILSGDPKFQEALNEIDRQNTFKLEGEEYKKNQFLSAPKELWPWLNRKNFCLEHASEDFSRLFSADFSIHLQQELRKLSSLYTFLVYAEEYKSIEC